MLIIAVCVINVNIYDVFAEINIFVHSTSSVCELGRWYVKIIAIIQLCKLHKNLRISKTSS